MYGQTRPIFIAVPAAGVAACRLDGARRAEAAAGIAVVAAGAVAPDPAGDLVAGIAAALAELLPERAELAGRLVERAAVLGRARLDRPAQVGGVAARERRPAGPDRLERVRVAVADVGQAVLVGEPDDAAVPRLAEAGRVERLETVGTRGRVRVGEEPAEHPALGAQRVRDERVGRDGQAARLVDREDRRPQRAVRPDRPVEIERQQVAAERRDLLADDDLDAQAAVARHRPRGERRVDPLVIRDRDDVEVGRALDVVEDRLDAGRPVAGERVDVEVGAAEALRASVMRPLPRIRAPPMQRRPRPRGPARSGRRPPTTGRGRRR